MIKIEKLELKSENLKLKRMKSINKSKLLLRC